MRLYGIIILRLLRHSLMIMTAR
ncbi:hypothetical protein [Pedobacter antarcticus]